MQYGITTLLESLLSSSDHSAPSPRYISAQLVLKTIKAELQYGTATLSHINNTDDVLAPIPYILALSALYLQAHDPPHKSTAWRVAIMYVTNKHGICSKSNGQEILVSFFHKHGSI